MAWEEIWDGDRESQSCDRCPLHSFESAFSSTKSTCARAVTQSEPLHNCLHGGDRGERPQVLARSQP